MQYYNIGMQVFERGDDGQTRLICNCCGGNGRSAQQAAEDLAAVLNSHGRMRDALATLFDYRVPGSTTGTVEFRVPQDVALELENA